MKNFLYEDVYGVSEEIRVPVKYKEIYDVFVRADAYGSSKGILGIKEIKEIYPTSTVEYAFRFIPSVLSEVIRSLKRQLDFNGYYIAFLLEQIDEKEFKRISRKFITEKKKIPLEELKDKVLVIKNFVSPYESMADMAHYFQCDEEDIINSTKLLKA